MARRTRCRETCGLVIRICRGVERSQVAAFAGLRRTAELVAYVALLAGQRNVLPGERELRGCIVVELSTRPLRSCMTSPAGNRKARRFMIRLVGIVELHHVTGCA